MSQKTSLPEEIVPISTEEPKKKQPQVSLEELLDSLKNVQDDVGQICELTSEEKSFVAALFESLFKLMKPLATTMPVSLAALPRELGNIVQAGLDPAGHLIVLHADGRMELKSLSEEVNRDLMISVVRDVLPKFKQFTNAHRQKIENRIKFLSLVTKELQKISKAFSTATS